MLNIFYTFLLSFLVFGAHANPYSSDVNSVTSKFTSSHTKITPGQTFDLLWNFNPASHWHTYWKNPGDTGFKNIIDWSLPEGFKVGDIKWPTPTAMLTETIMSYVYTRPSTLIIPITAPINLPLNETLNLSAHVTFLACAEVCIPIEQDITTQIITASKMVHNHRAEYLLAHQSWPLKINDLKIRIIADSDNFYFKIPQKTFAQNAKTLRFIPNKDEIILDASPQKLTLKKGVYTLTIARDKWFERSPDNLSGLLVIKDTSYELINLPITYIANDLKSTKLNYSLLLILIFSFISGLILNLMPCVLPVLALKVLSLIKQSNGKPMQYALAYTAGILVSFWALGGIIMFLKTTGQQLGWGFHLQSPIFVFLLTLLMLTLALSFFGLFHFNGIFSKLENSNNNCKGLFAPFSSGVLVTLVATPCTAPFMGTAIAYALTAPIVQMLLTLSFMGLGLSLPFLLLALKPNWLSFLPKPGKWMDTFKKTLGVPLLLTAIWLCWVFWQLIAPVGTLPSNSIWQRWTLILEKELEEKNLPIFINATADWCITCKVTEKLVFDNKEFKQIALNNNIQLLEADWTKRNDDITGFIKSYNREGVPLYILKIPGKPVQILPQFLRLKNFKKALANQL